jgi:hypothetical protein
MSVPNLPGLECEQCKAPADTIARGLNCLWAEDGMPGNCGGHLLCSNCFDHYSATGWVVPDAPT